MLNRVRTPPPGHGILPRSRTRKIAATVKIAIDDFGTGYSSLEYLRRLPGDCVKVDRSFVRDVPDNEEDVAIVNAVIELGQAVKLSVTAEGVETTEQLGNFQTAGCDTAQGFLFFRPEPPEELAKLFAGAQATAEAGIACPGTPPDSRRRLVRSSLLAGFWAMADTWVSGGNRP